MRIEVSTPVKRSARVMQIEGMFDVPPSAKSDLSWELPEELLTAAGQGGVIARGESNTYHEWGVGLIVGPSGSGKSTIARHLWPEAVSALGEQSWPTDRAVVDAFDPSLGVKDVVGLLTSVGFSSPPAWLRPFNVLSTGEQFRASMARLLSDTSTDPIVVDEFTSTVDRRVAQIGSHTIQKTARKRGQRFIAVTCHFDVLDWLQPDWVYRPDSNDFEWRRLQRHPELVFDVHRVDRSYWNLFRRHHYLSAELHVAAKCWCAFERETGQPVAFNAHYKFPHPKAKDIMVSSRTVVLPDFQGLGLGGRLTEFVGQWLWDHCRYRYRATLAHPALIAYRAASPRWRMETARNLPSKSAKPKRLVKQHSNPRKLATRTFEYVPA